AEDFRTIQPVYAQDTRLPAGLFDAHHRDLDHLLTVTFSDGFNALDAPRMDRSGALMRITFLPDHGTPFLFAIQLNAGAFSITYKQSSGFIGLNNGRVETRRTAPVPASDFAETLAAFDALAPCENNTSGRISGARGSVWILETLNGGYCARAYPNPTGPGARALIDVLEQTFPVPPRMIQAERRRLERTQ
ncbi:MAG: hypothetical protein AAF761_01550, partial [Pseudomonadota bacterium]